MFRLNLKIALRSLLKNKVYAAINIGGLSLGLTAFVLLLLYVNHEESYDKWDTELKNVYKVREMHDFFTPDNKAHWQDNNESRVASVIKTNIPQVAYTTKIDQEWGDGFSIKVDNADPILMKGLRDADTAFFKVFPYHFIQGDENTALDKPNTAVFKKSLAIQLFGTEKVLGKTFRLVRWRGDEGNPMTITGVIEDPKGPESITFKAITHTGSKDKDPEELSNSNYCLVFARLNQNADTGLVNKNIQSAYITYKKKSLAARKTSYDEFIKKGNVAGLKLIPIAEVHATPPFEINWFEKLKPVMAIAAFLFLVSIINFINLATAQSVQRAKEVGVRKVLGSYKKQLVYQFLMEAALQSILALFACIILVELTLPAFNNQFNVALTFWHSPQLPWLLLQLTGVFVLVTIMAGLYPSWVMSNFDPVAVLKGNFGNGLKGVLLRNVLVVFQFVISVTFIIAIGIMHQQSNYMASKDLGFDRNRLINIKTNYEDDFADRVKRIPGVKYVATTTQVIGNTFNVPQELIYKGKTFTVNGVTVTMDALDALGVKLVEGRLFSKEYAQDTVNSVVINEAAAKLLDKNMIGKTYDVISSWNKQKYTFQVVGVIKNYHNEGFDKEVIPTVYKVTQLGGSSSTNNLLVRFDNDNPAAAIKQIEAEWRALYPNFPMLYQTVENAFKDSLEENERFTYMVLIFSIISVALSLLGLFALSTFIAKRRTKEIAVRKVLGASDFQIINMLNRSFVILVLLANLISWPIAYLIVNKWLSGFAYRIDMPVLPFIAATLISLLIAILTVSIQARRSAGSNPVDALKYE